MEAILKEGLKAYQQLQNADEKKPGLDVSNIIGLLSQFAPVITKGLTDQLTKSVDIKAEKVTVPYMDDDIIAPCDKLIKSVLPVNKDVTDEDDEETESDTIDSYDDEDDVKITPMILDHICHAIKVNVHDDTKNGLVTIISQLPGFSLADIKISVRYYESQNRFSFILSAECKEKTADSLLSHNPTQSPSVGSEIVLYHEIKSMEKVSRELNFPGRPDKTKINSILKNGLLYVTIPYFILPPFVETEIVIKE